MHAEERGAEKQVDDAVQEVVAAEGNEAPKWWSRELTEAVSESQILKIVRVLL